MIKLSDLKLLLKQLDVHPNKRLGQNFLIDQNIRNKIIGVCEVSKDDTILEIGPGLGALTEELCKRARKVIAIEKDTRLYDFLFRTCKPDNLELIHGDILEYDLKHHKNLKIIGNLPYYISSPILVYLLEHISSMHSIFITVQKEFAERLVARPGTKAYGSITCFTQFYTEPQMLFPMKRTVFYPVPEVDSCFLRLMTRKKLPEVKDAQRLFRMIRGCFGKRRKTILNSLCSSGIFPSKEQALAALQKTGISETRRPETISLEEFIKLSNIV